MVDTPSIPEPKLSEIQADVDLSSNRLDLDALIAKADHRLRAYDHKGASSYYGAALQSAAQSGRYHADLDRVQDLVGWLFGRFRDHLLTQLDQVGLTRPQRHPRFQKSLEIMLGERQRDPVFEAFPQMPLTYFYPDLPYVDFADAQNLPWRVEIESRFTAFRDEALAVLEGEKDFRPYVTATPNIARGDVHAMLENSDWSTFYLWEDGTEVPEHTARCPAISETIAKQTPLCHLGSRSPSVMLSLLRPGAHIPPHTGMLNCRFIAHLPLIVPENCGFRVGGNTIAWQEGRLILFDDTVQHEAWNKSNENRLILLFDVWRPELTPGEHQMIAALFNAVDSYGAT